jgi:hypothetical protein
MGALALVPVCFTVHPWCRSVVTICLSEVVPELYVVANVAEQASEYQGMLPDSEVLLTVTV